MKRLPPSATRFSWLPTHRLHGIFLSLLLCSLPAGAGHAAGPVAVNASPETLTSQDGKLTARFIAVPLRQILGEVSKLNGVQVFWLNQEDNEPMSVEFTHLSISEAVKQILHEKNFLLFYTPTAGDMKLTQIWVTSKSTGGQRFVRSSQPLLTEPAIPTIEDKNLEKQYDFDSMSFDTIIQIALNDEDSYRRLKTLSYLESHAQEDPKAWAILSQVAHSDTNPQVQEAATEILQGME